MKAKLEQATGMQQTWESDVQDDTSEIFMTMRRTSTWVGTVECLCLLSGLYVFVPVCVCVCVCVLVCVCMGGCARLRMQQYACVWCAACPRALSLSLVKSMPTPPA